MRNPGRRGQRVQAQPAQEPEGQSLCLPYSPEGARGLPVCLASKARAVGAGNRGLQGGGAFWPAGEHRCPDATLSAFARVGVRAGTRGRSREESGLTRPGDGGELFLGGPSWRPEQGKCCQAAEGALGTAGPGVAGEASSAQLLLLLNSATQAHPLSQDS